ncbi:MAG: hypothetical protein KDA41_10320 [Planctomycetales bacterium]|nr:hypothetical protein [Planctomycetales bacterium]
MLLVLARLVPVLLLFLSFTLRTAAAAADAGVAQFDPCCAIVAPTSRRLHWKVEFRLNHFAFAAMQAALKRGRHKQRPCRRGRRRRARVVRAARWQAGRTMLARASTLKNVRNDVVLQCRHRVIHCVAGVQLADEEDASDDGDGE